MANPSQQSHNKYIDDVCEFYRMMNTPSTEVLKLNEKYLEIVELAKTNSFNYSLNALLDDPAAEVTVDKIFLNDTAIEWGIQTHMDELRRLGESRFRDKYCIK